MSVASRLLAATRKLRHEVGQLSFDEPVTHVYNPLDYAVRPHSAYVRRFANSRKRVVFLGMNPGPFGMAQTGVPFGEVSSAPACACPRPEERRGKSSPPPWPSWVWWAWPIRPSSTL